MEMLIKLCLDGEALEDGVEFDGVLMAEDPSCEKSCCKEA